ncbi:MAG: MFS transporter [Alphaproteobacteria bacterium]
MIVLRVFLPFAAGYFLSYLFRTVNAVAAPHIMADLGLGPGLIGLLTGAYFLAFAAAQLPLGYALDRFGPRRSEATLLTVAAGGSLLFAMADSVTGLVIGRALIGLGVSACLMASLKIFALWYPRERLPLINGMVLATGGLGALAATTPVEVALGLTDWRGVFVWLAALTLAAAAAIIGVVPEKARTGPGGSPPAGLDGLRRVVGDPRFWRIAPVTAMVQAAYLAIQGLWAGAWLRTVAGHDALSAANHLLVMAVAMVAGYLALGALSTHLTRRGYATLHVAAGGMLIFLLVQVGLVLQLTWLSWPLIILFGFFGTAGTLSFAVLAGIFSTDIVGRANTTLNLLIFVGAFAVQAGMGWLIEHWPAGGYPAAFGIVLVLEVAGFAWLLVSPARLDGSTEPPQ